MPFQTKYNLRSTGLSIKEILLHISRLQWYKSALSIDFEHDKTWLFFLTRQVSNNLVWVAKNVMFKYNTTNVQYM